MAGISWPGTFEQPDWGSKFTPYDNVIRSGTDSPMDKVRRRWSANASGSGTYKLVLKNETQRAAFVEFFVDTLSGGLKEFDMPDPQTSHASPVTYDWRFVGPYSMNEENIDLYSVTFDLERLRVT